jgi:hypothetical protein
MHRALHGCSSSVWYTKEEKKNYFNSCVQPTILNRIIEQNLVLLEMKHEMKQKFVILGQANA